MSRLKEAQKRQGGLGISLEEKDMVLKAMGLSKGHWYQCPNGHVYAITECGGAMVEGRCPDCQAVIGGGQHQLRGDNRVATAMDGAQHGAYTLAQDMANFDFRQFMD
jgi:hypothetical protein